MNRVTIILAILFTVFCRLFPQPQSGGLALSLDGNGAYMRIPNSQSLALSQHITLEAWVKPNVDSNGDPIITKWKTEPSARGSWWLAKRSNTPRPLFMVSPDGVTGAPELYADSALTINDFSHVAATYSVTDDTMRIYINGRLAGKRRGSAGFFVSDSKVLIGAAIYGSIYSYFTGLIDEVRIWKKALTLEQLQTTMNDTLGSQYYNIPDSGVVAYWRFDRVEDLGIFGGGVDDIRDYSGNGNHGDMEGNWNLASVTNVEETRFGIPLSFILRQNYPNPFNPSTTICYQLPSQCDVTLKIFDVLGREGATLVNEKREPGRYEARFDGAGLPSGVYFARLQAGDFMRTIKLALVR